MRKLYFLMMVMLVGLSSCVVVKVPPGQAKKATKPPKAAPGQVKKTTGSKSAAPYAPGQQKKGAASPAGGKKKK